ncbi:MAG: heavy metal translocating P-type ATPase [Candidatus Eiseniibacteriota bacterium]
MGSIPAPVARTADIAPLPALAVLPGAAATPSECRHCGLPVPRERRRRADPFCCSGCRSVHDLIGESGLARFYDLRRGAIAPPARDRADSFAWLDRLTEGEAPGVRRLALDVQGVHCAACVWLLQELFARTPGAVHLRVNPAAGTADVSWSPAGGDLRVFLAEALRFGYRFGPARKQATTRSRGLLLRLGISTAAAMNVMMFSLSYYFGLSPQDGVVYPYFGWLNLALGTVAVAAAGPVFFRGAWLGVRRRLVHLDLPISLGILLAWGGSVWEHFARGPQAAYFDSLAAFVTLMLLGRWLQERVLERNRRALLAAEGVDGLSARRLRDGRLGSVPASELRKGDEVWVVPGDLVPLDGRLLEGPALVSLDWIDGESRVGSVEAGGTVRAGSFNAGDAAIRLLALQGFGESRLVDLLAAMPEADDARRSGAWWHRVSTGYVAAVLALAVVGFLSWSPAGVERAFQVTVSILVVTCPCALGLATPLAHEMIHAALRRRGVFVRSATFTDRALGIRKVLFDKTGTLTRSGLRVTSEGRRVIGSLTGEARGALYNLAVRSNHPVSVALAAALAEDDAPDVLRGAAVREVAGLGLEWSDGERMWRLGRRDFALGSGSAANGSPLGWRSEAVLSADGRLLAAIPWGEDLRDDAAEELAALAGRGLEVHLLSGDAPDRVEAAARELGIPADRARARLSPEDKAALVASLDRRDTLMIGDGLNDAPSLSAAWTSGTPAVDHASLPARADFYFLGGGLGAVRAAIELPRVLRSVVRDNLVVAVAYNVAALALCFAGLVTPVHAAVLMPLSSAAIVSVTAWRLSERRLSWK